MALYSLTLLIRQRAPFRYPAPEIINYSIRFLTTPFTAIADRSRTFPAMVILKHLHFYFYRHPTSRPTLNPKRYPILSPSRNIKSKIIIALRIHALIISSSLGSIFNLPTNSFNSLLCLIYFFGSQLISFLYYLLCFYLLYI